MGQAMCLESAYTPYSRHDDLSEELKNGSK
jgi:hypothetical protein